MLFLEPRAFSLELANIAERPEALQAPSPEVSQVFLRLSTQPVAIFGYSFLRKLRLALVSRLESPESRLRQPAFEAYRKIARKLLMSHLIAVLKLKLDVYRCSLTREPRFFSSHGSYCLVQRERPTASETAPLKKYVRSTLLLHHLTPGFNSNTPRSLYTANLESCE